MSAGVFVSDMSEGSASLNKAVQYTLLFALLLILPGIQGSLFGWLFLAVPLASFFYRYRWQHGARFVGIGTLLALAVGAATGIMTTTILAAALMPAGYVLASSAFQGDSPSKAGFKGGLTICACWFALVIGETMFTGVNPVSAFLGSLDTDIEGALSYYRQSETIAPDTLALLEQSFYQMKVTLPRVLPALLVSLALFISWFTMLVGNRIVRRVTGYEPWIEHRNWQLPERLIWLFIGTALLAILPLGSTRLAGINGLIILSLVYTIQGFSILSFFADKWKVPPILRFFLYGMMLFQSFGTVILLIAGLADVWLDLRKIKKNLPGSTDQNTGQN